MSALRPNSLDSARRYTRTAITLHWTIAALVVALLVTGWWMTRMPAGSELQFALFQLHKSLGVTTLILSLARLGWRLTVAPPPPPRRGPRWERGVARAMHAALLALAIVTPLAGWVVVSASIWNIPTLVFGLVPWPHLPVLAELAPETKRSAAPILATSHAIVAYAMASLAVLHAGAALFHHFVRADGVLLRMLPARTRRPRGSRRRDVSRSLLLSLMVSLHADEALARDWIVDASRSTLGFAGTETGNAFKGGFARWEAQIAFDPGDPAAARVRVIVDIGSATTNERRRDEAMLGEDWLDAGRFPNAVFEASGFRPLGGGRFETTGTLAIRDQRRPVALTFVLAEHEGGTRARGEAVLIRTQFGVGRGQWSGVQVVGLEVKIVFDLVARRAQ